MVRGVVSNPVIMDKETQNSSLPQRVPQRQECDATLDVQVALDVAGGETPLCMPCVDE